MTTDPMAKVAELRACPYPHEVKRGVFLDVDEEEFAIVRGACDDCGACGPFVSIEGGKVSDDERAEATRLWNALLDQQAAAMEGMRVALEYFQSFGCPACSGDCGSANPPVDPQSCPMQRAAKALATVPARTFGEGGDAK